MDRGANWNLGAHGAHGAGSRWGCGALSVVATTARSGRLLIVRAPDRLTRDRSPRFVTNRGSLPSEGLSAVTAFGNFNHQG